MNPLYAARDDFTQIDRVLEYVRVRKPCVISVQLETFKEVFLWARGYTFPDAGCMHCELRRVDDQRTSFPVADGMTLVGRFCGVVGVHIHVNHTLHSVDE